MAKYVFKTTTKWLGTEQETDLPFFDDEDFRRYENGSMDDRENESYLQTALEDQGLEWWIEKVEDED